MCPFIVFSSSPCSYSHSLMEPSSLDDATIWYIGWIVTFEILCLCPNRQCFSGYLGSPSPTEFDNKFPPETRPYPPPHLSHICYSFSYLFCFSSSMTYFFNFATDVHFFSNTSFITEEELLTPLLWDWLRSFIPVSSEKTYADFYSLLLTRYSYIAWFNSSLYFDVKPTILCYSLNLIYILKFIFFQNSIYYKSQRGLVLISWVLPYCRRVLP